MAEKQQKKSSEIQNWFGQLIAWIRTLFNNRKPQVTTVKSRRYSEDRTTALLQLQRDTPGAVETWRLIHGQSPSALLIGLDNLPDCRQHYKQERRAAHKSGNSYQTSANERSLKMAGGEIHTHRFSFSWLESSQGRQRIKILGVFDGDFAGFTREYGAALKAGVVSTKDENLKRRLGNSAAVKIGEAIALELLELKSIPGISWEERIQNYDWHHVLEAYTRRVHKPSRFDPKIIDRTK